MRICTICKEVKNTSDFKKDKRRKDGFGNHCKECLRRKGIEYYHRTKEYRKEKINENRRNSHHKNKEIENNRSKEYKLNNKDKIKKYNKEYREKNIEKVKDLAKNYRSKNKEKYNNYQRKYFNYKLNSDIIFKLSHTSRNIIRKALFRNGFKKNSKTENILGCSFDEFRKYLESKFENWMNWDNRGLYNGEFNYGWDIDHIIPLSSAKTEEEIIKLSHYTNLQPLCSKINRDIKKDKS